MAGGGALAHAAGRLLELGWLYLLCGIPLIFGVAQTRNFDFLKTLHLRGVVAALVTVAICDALILAAIPAAADVSSRRWRVRDLSPLGRAALVGAGAYLLSVAAATLASLVPRISLVGSHIRNAGLFTEAAYVALFVLLVLLVRERAQVARCYDAVVTAGAFVSAYGIAQRLGIDPLGEAYPLAGGAVASSVGNSGFLGAFLAAALCATAGRLFYSLRTTDDCSGSGFRVLCATLFAVVLGLTIAFTGARHPAPWWLLTVVPAGAVLLIADDGLTAPRWWGQRRADRLVFGAASLLELGCLSLTQARAAWIAAALALLVFFVAVVRRPALVVTAAAAAGSAIAVVVVVLVSSVQGSGLEPLARLPLVSQVAASAGGRQSVDARVAIWSDMTALIVGLGKAQMPEDTVTSLRPLVGYGPGTVYLISDMFASERRRQVEGARIDRAHNEPLDRAATTGAFGLATYVGLVAVLLALALRRSSSPAGRGDWLPAVAGSALVCLLVSDLFGPGDPTTRMLFWVFGGLLASTALAGRSRGQVPMAAAPATTLRPTHVAVLLGVAVAILAVALASQPPPVAYWWIIGIAAVLTVGGLTVASLIDRQAKTSGPERAGIGAWVCLASFLLFANLRPAEADLFNKAALLAIDQRLLLEAIELSRWSIAISPNEELYYMTLGGAIAELARALPERAGARSTGPALSAALQLPGPTLRAISRNDALALAQAAFERARGLDPYDFAHYLNLARLADLQALGGDASAEERRQRYLETVLRLSPGNREVVAVGGG